MLILSITKLGLFFQITHQKNSGFTLNFPFAFLLLPYLKIGFVWLCFSPLSKDKIPHNSLSYRHLCPFWFLKIGFVFSNCVFDPQQCWGLRLALFFSSLKASKFINTLLYKSL